MWGKLCDFIILHFVAGVGLLIIENLVRVNK